ncbi:MAG: TetR/AcrR family transcriptional regulator [Solirubrobacterales bacterium]|nr:TetR/AcrR family transcriptional regulator [Solirubrobacterales bacterium]MBV9334760.1 TetR/AcrR family transcriptional regulator [Solirubrobacterales bacterium]MBV9917006.1 TetR/AcrR family transcriptional regulator [Solirubrobacterales bacterium]
MTTSHAGRPRDPRLDEAILDAGLALFVDGGIGAASFEAIAERTGASRSSIYRRWRTREDLLLAAIDRLRVQRETGAEDWASRPIGEVLDLFRQLTVAAANDPLSVGLLRQMFALEPGSPIKRAYWSTVIEPRREMFAKMIVAARHTGEISPGPEPGLLQDLLAGAIAYWLLMHPEAPDEQQAESYVLHVLSALGLDPSRAR